MSRADFPHCIKLDYNDTNHRIAELENEVDKLQGKQPRNKYTCTVCYGERRIDESYHGSPDYQPCSYCDGGRWIDLANETLLEGK